MSSSELKENAVKLPTGTTAQRPGSPVAGDTRFNSDLDKFEVYDGTDWGFLKYEPDGSAASKAAASASAIKSLTGTTTDGLYWINVSGTPTEIYCDMNTDGGGWMLSFRCKNYNNQGCTNGTWDFPLVLNAGGSNPPTSPTGNLSGLTEGYSPSNRQALWESGGCTEIRATKGDSSTINFDFKWLSQYPFDASNMFYHAAAGGHDGSSSDYSNQWVPSGSSDSSGPGSSKPIYVLAASSRLTVGQSYGVYSHGHYSCGCCEEYFVNQSTNYQQGSGVQLMGDGRLVQNHSGLFGGQWTSFWVR